VRSPHTELAMKSRYLVAVIALVGAFAIALAALVVRANAQAGMNHAALIVQMKDGSIATSCVAFKEAEITGYDLLRRAEIPVVADVSNGVSICKIGSTSGCDFPAQKCFCECQDLNSTCIYWMYYYQDKGQWKYATLGAGAQKVRNGDVNGWVYGAGTASGGILPPAISYEQICDVAAPPPPTVPGEAISTTVTSTLTPTTEALVVAATDTAQVTSTAPVTGTSTLTATTAAQIATALPSPSSTAMLTPTATLTTAPSATFTPPPATSVPTSTPMPVASAEQPASNILGYVVFGVIAVGLVAFLIVTRRNSGKANG